MLNKLNKKEKIITMIIALLAIALMAVISTVVTQTSQTKDDKYSIMDSFKSESSKTLIGNNKISYKNNDISFPINYKEFSKLTGFSFNNGVKKHKIAPNRNISYDVKNENGDLIYVHLFNNKDTDISYEDAVVYGITIDCIENSNNTEIIFPGNYHINGDTTKEELIKNLGKPQSEYNYKNFDSYCWRVKYENSRISDSYTIDISNGKITEISYQVCPEKN